MGVYLICYAASYILARFEHYSLSGIVLMAAAAYLYWYDYRRSGNIIHLRGVFSLFWVGGQGISCLKLSNLQVPWATMTWVCFLLALSCFWVTFEVMNRLLGNTNRKRVRWDWFVKQQKPIYLEIIVITSVSLAAFLFEAATLGFIPLFLRGVPHAYSAFHISGVHYFTVSCVLVPPLTVLYFLIKRGERGCSSKVVIIMTVIAFLIPILCVSRFQLIFAVMLAVFTFIAFKGNISPVYAIGVLLAMIPLYLILTVARSHNIEYLNGIFEMKNSGMPIFVSQPYIYIANNYDNFNCMVEYLPRHAFGMRALFPLFALTGLKFINPSLINYPIIVNKQELTTLTMFYDSYYDFGVVGVILFSCLLGAVAYFMVSLYRKMRNPIGYVFYAQFAVYMVLSFFTTWFSNPATWFYLIATGIVYFYCYWKS